MHSNSLVFFKIFISFAILLVAINSMIKGFIFLNNQNLININNVKLTELNLTKNYEQKIENNKVKTVKKEKESAKIINTETFKYNLNEEIITVKKNDTFYTIIDPFLDNNIKNKIINEINKKFDLKYLKVGQKIFLYKNHLNEIKQIILPIDFDKEIIVNLEKNNINVVEKKLPILKDTKALDFEIFSSFYADGVKAGMPSQLLSETIRLYSFDIDFQRDIKVNTKFEILYEYFINEKNNKIKFGDINYINLKIDNKDLEYFLFKTDDGFYDYFNREGKNIRKSLLKTPIDGARLSSNFGMRKHPISGFNKLHKGVDFAAPIGTPVYAGGNGVVEYIGTNGGYGKYIRIRHNNEYKTAYAHLSSYKKGLYKGKRVNQSDIIGFVGNTGNSTGPHLHYEIIFQNKHINPMKLKLPSGKILKGEELKRFLTNMKSIYAKHLFELYE